MLPQAVATCARGYRLSFERAQLTVAASPATATRATPIHVAGIVGFDGCRDGTGHDSSATRSACAWKNQKNQRLAPRPHLPQCGVRALPRGQHPRYERYTASRPPQTAIISAATHRRVADANTPSVTAGARPAAHPTSTTAALRPQMPDPQGQHQQ
jgi:hypothetical protein